MKKLMLYLLSTPFCSYIFSQQYWKNVDADFGPLPQNFHVYNTNDSLDGKPFIAYYAEALLKDKKLNFTTDTTLKRRLTPKQFYEKNEQSILVVNGTFFSFVTNQNLNVVIKNGKIVSHTVKKLKLPTDTTILIDKKMIRGAIGIYKNRNADVAWIKTDSSKKYVTAVEDSKFIKGSLFYMKRGDTTKFKYDSYEKWKVETAIGGGPVLLQNGEIKITNEEEEMFVGSAINDKHPRTCMGYTADGRLIVMVIQGRFPGIAEGATLTQEAKLLQALGCVEGLNLDGGGSSCMLINGKETIKPSDKEGERPVPAVFLIEKNH